MSVHNLHRYPSMGSVHSTTNPAAYMPHSRAYLPRKTSPPKPYGPSFVTVMNRMWRGSGRKYVIYAIISLCAAVLFFVGGALYFGHRNVSRMIVLNTEVLGALMIAMGILFSGAFFHFMYQANMASNRWRSNVRFRAEGLSSVAAYNKAYMPDDEGKLATGTYGPNAIIELNRGRPNRNRSRGPFRPTMSGAITPRTPLIYAEQDMGRFDGREDSARSSMVQWPTKIPSAHIHTIEPSRELAQPPYPEKTSIVQGFDEPDVREMSPGFAQGRQVPPTPSPPLPPPPPTALPPVNRQPVSSGKASAQSTQHLRQQQQKMKGPVVTLNYDGSESEL